MFHAHRQCDEQQGLRLSMMKSLLSGTAFLVLSASLAQAQDTESVLRIGMTAADIPVSYTHLTLPTILLV